MDGGTVDLRPNSEVCCFVNRGDKTPLELFVSGVQGWEAWLRRQFEDSKYKSGS